MKRMMLWDYGGVFTNGSRFKNMVSAVNSVYPHSNNVLIAMENEGIFTDLAKGAICAREVLNEITQRCGIQQEVFLRVASNSTVPNPKMIAFARKINSLGIPQYIVSDNIPFYSSIIKLHLKGVVDGVFLSDELRCRKKDGLITEAVHIIKSDYDQALYVDDSRINCEIAIEVSPLIKALCWENRADGMRAVAAWIQET